MSKRQQNRHEQSIVRIAAYEAISPADKKKGFTRPALVACKRVKKEGTYSLSRVALSLADKNIYVDLDLRTVDVRRAVNLGIGTRGKISYLKNYHQFAIITQTEKNESNSRTERVPRVLEKRSTSYKR